MDKITSIDLSDDDKNKLLSIESSLLHWSKEHTNSSIRTAESMEQIRNLVRARAQVIESLVPVPSGTVKNVRLDLENGKIIVEED